MTDGQTDSSRCVGTPYERARAAAPVRATMGRRKALFQRVTLRRTSVSSESGESALARARSDAEAFNAFYDAYAQRMLVFFARRVYDVELALDMTAETFALAFERRRQFRGSTLEEEQGWLFAIARSQLSRYWRRGFVERQALRRLAIDVPHLSGWEIERVEELADLDSRRGELEAAMADLPVDQRRAIELRILEELDYVDVAAALAVSEDVARARVSRGLRALASELARGLQPLSEVP